MPKGWFGRFKRYLQRKKPAVIISYVKRSYLPARSEDWASEVIKPITMYYGDTTDISWDIKLKHNAQAGTIEIWNKDQFAGLLSSQEDYEVTHSLHIEYRKENDE